MAETGAKTFKLQVANALPQDAGCGVARLGLNALAELGLQEGNIIEIIGKRHTAAVAVGIRPAKGSLLFGPPGTGKTLLAKAVARESEANFVATKSSDLLSKWYGESEQQGSWLFERARQVPPTMVFIDEMARWCARSSKRDRSADRSASSLRARLPSK